MIGSSRTRNTCGEQTCIYGCCRMDGTRAAKKAAKRRIRTREKRAWKRTDQE